MTKLITIYFILLNLLNLSTPIRVDVNDKFLANDYKNEETEIDRRKRPSSGYGYGSGCNFNKKRTPVYKTDGNGRTFLDFAYLNVGYNYEYNINCGSSYPPIHNNYDEVDQYHKPGFSGHHKPGFGGHQHPKPPHHKPPPPPHHKPGGHNKPGSHHGTESGQTDDTYGNRPLLSLLGNRPLQGLFGNSEVNNQPSIINNVATSISNVLPSPQEFGQGVGDGITSFIQTFPQIAQSFQSLLPNFDKFQWPQFGTPGTGQNVPIQVQTPAPVAPNDEVKPVHEDYDPITDPYKLRNRFDHHHLTKPGQYFIVSHPLLGSSTFPIPSFNPIKFYQGLAEEVEDLLGDVFNF